MTTTQFRNTVYPLCRLRSSPSAKTRRLCGVVKAGGHRLRDGVICYSSKARRSIANARKWSAESVTVCQRTLRCFMCRR